MAKRRKRKGKILPTEVSHNYPISPTDIGEFTNKNMLFSFSYFDLSNRKFFIKSIDHINSVFSRLKELSTWKMKEYLSSRSPSLKQHPIDWKNTTEKKGFSHLNEQLRQIGAYQFNVSRNEHGRVHGFIIENVFFIVWLDPAHELYR